MTHAMHVRQRPGRTPSDTAPWEFIADTVGWKTMIEDVRRDGQGNLMAAVRVTGTWVMEGWPAADMLLWLPVTAAATMQLAIQECSMVYGLTGLVEAEVERLRRLYDMPAIWGHVEDPGETGGRGDTEPVGAGSPR